MSETQAYRYTKSHPAARVRGTVLPAGMVPALPRQAVQPPTYTVIYDYWHRDAGIGPRTPTLTIPESQAYALGVHSAFLRYASHWPMDLSFYAGPQRRRDANTDGPNAGLVLAGGSPLGGIGLRGQGKQAVMLPRPRHTKVVRYPRASIAPAEYGPYGTSEKGTLC